MSPLQISAKFIETRDATRRALDNYDMIVEPWRERLRLAGDLWFLGACEAMQDLQRLGNGLAVTLIMCAVADHAEALARNAGDELTADR